MDVVYFLKDRTRMIRGFYDAASSPFMDTKRKIEAGEPPFVPPYSDDEEPPFLQQWQDADTYLQLVGRSCVGMLSETLKLYFSTWERLLWVDHKPCYSCYKSAFEKKGWLQGYRECLSRELHIDWAHCPASLAVLEQVILVRNTDQHGQDITNLRVRHDEHFLRRHPSPYFADPREVEMLGEERPYWLNPSVVVTRETLFDAIDQSERLAEWLEVHLLDARFPRRSEPVEAAPGSD